METVQILNKKNIKIIMRKEFYYKYRDIFFQLKNDYKISYFSNNIIQNYYKDGHQVSTFGMKEEWSELYWDKYWDQDPVEKICHSITLKKSGSISVWKSIDEESECAQKRAEKCGSKDGFLMALDHGQGLLENISFGWEKETDQTLNLKKINFLNNLIKPLRQHHLMTYNLYG